MEDKKIVKAVNKTKQSKTDTKVKDAEVSLEAQERLAEILNDSPRVESLAGTEWEIRTLRQKVQWMIAAEVIKINKVENANFGDVVKQFAQSMPSVVKVITLAVLNDRNKIFKNGREEDGFSDLYKATYDTIAWDGNVNEYGNLLLDVLQMLDIGFFLESHRILEMFRAATMTRKTSQTAEQK